MCNEYWYGVWIKFIIFVNDYFCCCCPYSVIIGNTIISNESDTNDMDDLLNDMITITPTEKQVEI